MTLAQEKSKAFAIHAPMEVIQTVKSICAFVPRTAIGQFDVWS
jgi:hypothetical protein